MMMIECEYEFLPPDGSACIKVLGVQPYASGQSRKVTVWQLKAPSEHKSVLGSGPAEYDNWKTLLAALANMFCGGDQKAAEARLTLKFDQRPQV